jgi:hypothetical protein
MVGVDRTGSGSYPVAGFGVSSVETPCPVSRESARAWSEIP